jgi:hypothetical protein
MYKANRLVNSKHINTKLEYSASSIQLNHKPLYSVTKPATSSLSDSIVSNGSRLHSTNTQIHAVIKSNKEKLKYTVQLVKAKQQLVQIVSIIMVVKVSS